VQQDVHDTFVDAVHREVKRAALSRVAGEFGTLVHDVRVRVENPGDALGVTLLRGGE
jgi:hypothetical protein